MKFLKYLLIFVVGMCLDINKYIDIVSTKELDNIDNITRIINSYDINELITYSEFQCDYDEINFTYEKCETDCFDEVNSMFHAFQHYEYLMELTFATFKLITLLRVFLKVHKDFDMEEYSIQPNGHVIFNIKHRASGFNYFLTFDFSSNHILIKRLMFII